MRAFSGVNLVRYLRRYRLKVFLPILSHVNEKENESRKTKKKMKNQKKSDLKVWRIGKFLSNVSSIPFVLSEKTSFADG